MSSNDPMTDIFVYETQQLIDSLEDVLLSGEKSRMLDDDQINEVFRVMHTIKGSAAMMEYDGMATLAHSLEDLFSQIREKRIERVDWAATFDVVLEATDVFKATLEVIAAGESPSGEATELISKIRSHLSAMTDGAEKPADTAAAAAPPEVPAMAALEDAPYYKARITFEENCLMENLRAFGVVTELAPLCPVMVTVPDNLMEDAASEKILESGFIIYFQTNENPDSIKAVLDGTLFLESSSIITLTDDDPEIPEQIRPAKEEVAETKAEIAKDKKAAVDAHGKQNFISVNVNKLDKLMDLVGEIVTTESMVTKNPEIVQLQCESFERSGQQLHKLINEMQDVIMSVRMIPMSTSFHKMQRIVRDVSKKVGKEVQLTIIGETTEVDKTVIDNLSDPLMHLIRNAVDHGIETPEQRRSKGKNPAGQLTLEARNTGGDVILTIADDGKGMSRDTIIKKAIEKGLTAKAPGEISDKEAFSFVFHPGFSTKENVTEFSGRGVGMDVVRQNIEKINGTISIDSQEDQGTTITIRIPLTLAIIEGMKLRVGNLIFIAPLLTIRDSFKPETKNIILDPDGNEMIMIRGDCYPIMRLHRVFNLNNTAHELEDGILVTIETDNAAFCLFVDELIGEQQAVIKPLPPYIQRHNTGLHGIGGCAILGDGSISLIIDINNLVSSDL